MISNQILQTNIEGLKGITRVDLCICDTEGKVLASTFTGAEEYESAILAFVDSPADSQVIQGYQFFKVFDDHQLEYILLAKGGSDDVYMVGKMAAFQVQNLLVAYKERFDKDNFIKNLLLDNLLLVDIYNRAKKLHIETNVKRIVFIIETQHEKDVNALETVRSLFSTKTKDFITAVDEKNIILVKEVKPGETYDDLEKTATSIVDMLNTESLTRVSFSIIHFIDLEHTAVCIKISRVSSIFQCCSGFCCLCVCGRFCCTLRLLCFFGLYLCFRSCLCLCSTLCFCLACAVSAANCQCTAKCH